MTEEEEEIVEEVNPCNCRILSLSTALDHTRLGLGTLICSRNQEGEVCGFVGLWKGVHPLNSTFKVLCINPISHKSTFITDMEIMDTSDVVILKQFLSLIREEGSSTCVNSLHQSIIKSIQNQKPLVFLGAEECSEEYEEQCKGLCPEKQNILRIILNRLNNISLTREEDVIDTPPHIGYPSNNDPSLFLVHGVFGSGKTTLAERLISSSIQLGIVDFVYVTAMTNIAVDNILSKLEENQNIDFEYGRFGSAKEANVRILSKFVSLRKANHMKLTKDLWEAAKNPSCPEKLRQLLAKGLVPGKLSERKDMKCLGSPWTSFMLSDRKNFPSTRQEGFISMLIIDEASQMPLPHFITLLAHVNPRVVVVIGDPNQLPPTVKVESQLAKSSFEMLQKIVKPLPLRTQYRCHPHIADLCSRSFYSGELKSGISINMRKSLFEPLPPMSIYLVPSTSKEEKHGNSWINDEEANYILKLLITLLSKEPEISIGVITFYKPQAGHVKDKIQNSDFFSPSFKKTILVSTVDAFQGWETDVILCATTKKGKQGVDNFNSCPRRLNVAISRAKFHFIAVGNSEFLKSHPIFKQFFHCVFPDTI
eukprot:GHVP01033395.1.p1 GENE.GHVP01033395.1~~GHVP01033395.1.p1  ORF type:complete len:593 (-),score=112.94 GHVP01033395.1:3638-5416(-)